MLQAYEAYLEEGQLYPTKPLPRIRGRKRVIVTILDEPTHNKPDTWDELDKLISEMSENEKPRFEDFPRCKFGRELINFEEV